MLNDDLPTPEQLEFVRLRDVEAETNPMAQLDRSVVYPESVAKEVGTVDYDCAACTRRI